MVAIHSKNVYKCMDHTNLMWVASVATGTLIPIYHNSYNPVKLIIFIDTISNIPVYEIQ